MWCTFESIFGVFSRASVACAGKPDLRVKVHDCTRLPSTVCDYFWIKQAPAAAPATPAPAPAAPIQQTAASQVASEAKSFVDKTAAELKPALSQAVQDKVSPIAQDLAKKLEPIAGDVSSHVNTALAEGVKQLNPIVDDVSSKAKGFVDDAAKQVRSLAWNITLHNYLLYTDGEGWGNEETPHPSHRWRRVIRCAHDKH